MVRLDPTQTLPRLLTGAKRRQKGNLTIVFNYQKQGCRDDRAKLLSEMHDNRKRVNSHK